MAITRTRARLSGRGARRGDTVCLPVIRLVATSNTAVCHASLHAEYPPPMYGLYEVRTWDMTALALAAAVNCCCHSHRHHRPGGWERVGASGRAKGDKSGSVECARMPGAEPDTNWVDRGLTVCRDRMLSSQGCCVCIARTAITL